MVSESKDKKRCLLEESKQLMQDTSTLSKVRIVGRIKSFRYPSSYGRSCRITSLICRRN